MYNNNFRHISFKTIFVHLSLLCCSVQNIYYFRCSRFHFFFLTWFQIFLKILICRLIRWNVRYSYYRKLKNLHHRNFCFFWFQKTKNIYSLINYQLLRLNSTVIHLHLLLKKRPFFSTPSLSFTFIRSHLFRPLFANIGEKLLAINFLTGENSKIDKNISWSSFSENKR